MVNSDKITLTSRDTWMRLKIFPVAMAEAKILVAAFVYVRGRSRTESEFEFFVYLFTLEENIYCRIDLSCKCLYKLFSKI